MRRISSRPRTAPSLRSAVEPFLVMDVMRAAIDREAAGRAHHPHGGRPAGRAGAAAGARRGARQPSITAASAIPRRSASGRSARASPATTPTLMASMCRRSASPSPPVPPPASTSPSSPPSIMATASRWPRPAIPAYRNILQALGLEVGRDPGRTRIPAMCSRRSCSKRRTREAPLAGVLVASPANPSGTMMPPEALGALIEAADDLGIRFISDEIYHGLVYDGVAETALRFSPRRDRRQLLLQVLLHDRLADRLDGAARGAGASGRAASRRTSTSRRRRSRSSRRSPPSTRRRSSRRSRRATPRTAASSSTDCRKSASTSSSRSTARSTSMPRSRRFTTTRVDFARRMLAEAGVAATPGPDFDRARGHR